MAYGFMDVFGDMLLKEPIPSSGGMLPSPNQLKKKIIIKVSFWCVDISASTVKHFFGRPLPAMNMRSVRVKFML